MTGILDLSPARRAVWWMVAAVVGYAVLPLLTWFGVRDMSPFVFVAVWYVVSAVCQTLLRQVQARFEEGQDHQSQQGQGQAGLAPPSCRRGTEAQTSDWCDRRRLVIFDVLRRVKLRYFLVAAATNLQWLLFAFAVTLVVPVTATVVFEFWPVVFGLLTLARFWRRIMLDGAPPANGAFARMLLLLFVGGVGVSLVVLSGTSSLGWSSTTVIGLVLAVLSVFGHALSATASQMMGAVQRDCDAGERVAVSASVDACSSVDPDRSPGWDRTVVSTSGAAVSKVLTAPVMVVAGVFVSLPGSGAVWAVSGLLFAGVAAVIHLTANWFFHHADHLARDAHGHTAASVNAFYFLTPVAALLLLVWLADTTIDRPGLLAAVVVAAVTAHVGSVGHERRWLFVLSSRNRKPRGG